MLQQIFQQPLPFETAFSHFVQSFSNPSLDYFFQIITHLGNPVLWVALAAFIYWSGHEKKSFFLGFSLLLTSAVVGLAKPLIDRPRPLPADFRVIAPSDPYSFPSGHSAVAASAFGYYYEKFRKQAKLVGIVIVLLVMLSRIYLGVHFLLDVVVGAFIGFIIGRAVHFFEQNYVKVSLHQKHILEEVGLIAAVLFALAISLAFRPFGAVSGLMGFFAGFFVFKLLRMDSAKIRGISLWVKEIAGFVLLGAIVLAGELYHFAPEAYFVAGMWITLFYPALYEMIARPTPAVQSPENAPAITENQSRKALTPRPNALARSRGAEPITLKKKSKRK